MSNSMHRPTLVPQAREAVPFSRRHFLWNSGGGLGAIALAWMLDREKVEAAGTSSLSATEPHSAPKAKRVVQVFCAAGLVT